MNSEQHLFDQFKQTPTELSLEEVNAIITTLPNTHQHSKHSDFFKYKFLSSIIFFTIILSLIIFKSDDENNTLDNSKITSLDLVKEDDEIDEATLEITRPIKEKQITLKSYEKNTEVKLESNIALSEITNPELEYNHPSISQTISISKLPVIPTKKLKVISDDPVSSINSKFLQSKLPNSKPKVSDYSEEQKTFSTKILEVKSIDPASRLERLKTEIQLTGLDIDLNHSYVDEKVLLKNITIHFRHTSGLDFNLTGTGFDRLQIKLFLNSQQQIQHFIYRFNEEDFTKPVPLHCKGNKSHFYKENTVGVTGKTNIDLGYKSLDSY